MEGLIGKSSNTWAIFHGYVKARGYISMFERYLKETVHVHGNPLVETTQEWNNPHVVI